MLVDFITNILKTFFFPLRGRGFCFLPSSVHSVSVIFALLLHFVCGNPIYFSFFLIFLLIWQSLNSLGFSHTGPLLYFRKSGTIWTYTFKIICGKLPVPPTSLSLLLKSQCLFTACSFVVCYSVLWALFWKAVNSVSSQSFPYMLPSALVGPVNIFLLAGICTEKFLPQIFSWSLYWSLHTDILRNCWTSYPCSTLYPQPKHSTASEWFCHIS